MKLRLIAPVLAAVLLPDPCPAAVPLPASPDWTSNDNDYSTGGAFADINADGYIDICTSNGNDMANDRNGIYFNRSGIIEATASWRSQDRGMFGHCYTGDVNNDGRPDLAVAYLGPDTSTSKLVARLYLNNGTSLDPTPCWRAADRHSSFDCCLGDFDLDGDLDLAITGGDVYTSSLDHAHIYRNESGILDTLPFWRSADSMYADAIRFCDVDNDRDLDLFIGQYRRVSMYRNQNGVLDSVPSWIARTGIGWVLRLAFGDYDNDGFCDLAVASNGQMGSINHVKVFHNNTGTLDTIAAFTMLTNESYSSCVAWGDVNGDGFCDLAAGGWWDPLVVFENNAGTLSTTPDWSWYPGSPTGLVCETVMWGDVTNSHLATVVEHRDGDGQRSLFRLEHRPVQFLDSVKVDGSPVPPAGFCHDPLAGWVSFAAPPPAGTGNVVFHYRYSTRPDLAVTNWESAAGNFLFLNTETGISAPAASPVPVGISARPNPARGPMTISINNRPGTTRGELRIFGPDGRLVRTIGSCTRTREGIAWTWDGRDNRTNLLPPGIYFARTGSTGPEIKLVRTR